MQQVTTSPEYRRIRDLPRRQYDLSCITDLTPLFAKPDGTWRLRPIQSLALLEMEAKRGAFLPIGGGHGKALISLLAPRACRAKRAVLVTTSSLVNVTRDVEIPKYGQHFELPPLHAVISYDDLSSKRNPNLLEELQPDLFIFDEGHKLRGRSVRTKRVKLYLRRHPETMVVVMSATMTANSLKDFAHLAKWALHQGSPVPYEYWALEDWGCAIDAKPLIPMGPGVLMKMCEHGHKNARQAFRCRMVSTPGVVATVEGSVATKLVIQGRRPSVPDSVTKALGKLRSSWSFADQEVIDVLGLYRVAHQLSMGFYYKWVWPNEQVDQDWIDSRARWAKFVRAFLNHRSRPGCDSEGLLSEHLARQTISVRADEQAIWARWKAAERRPGPQQETVWIDDFIVKDTQKYLAGKDNAILWYRNTAVGERLAKDLNLPHFGPGDNVKLAKATRDAYPVLVASIKAHHEGQNLQGWDRALILGVPGSAMLEQLLLRQHRGGQENMVESTIYQHTVELEKSFANARREARYVEDTFGQEQKLNIATMVDIG